MIGSRNAIHTARDKWIQDAETDVESECRIGSDILKYCHCNGRLADLHSNRHLLITSPEPGPAVGESAKPEATARGMAWRRQFDGPKTLEISPIPIADTPIDGIVT